MLPIFKKNNLDWATISLSQCNIFYLLKTHPFAPQIRRREMHTPADNKDHPQSHTNQHT